MCHICHEEISAVWGAIMLGAPVLAMVRVKWRAWRRKRAS